MGKTLSPETAKKMEIREKTVVALDKRFQKFGWRYLWSGLLGDKPWLCEGKRPYKPKRAVGIREAQAMLKKREYKN